MDQPSPSELRLQMIWRTVLAIPPGFVATYGDVARAAGLPGLARYVGYALRQLSADSRIPWHRVINSQGRLALPSDSDTAHQQHSLLRAEGVLIQAGRINLARYRYRFDASPPAAPTEDVASTR